MHIPYSRRRLPIRGVCDKFLVRCEYERSLKILNASGIILCLLLHSSSIFCRSTEGLRITFFFLCVSTLYGTKTSSISLNIFRSTKAFQQWLVKHPHLPMPPFLKKLDAAGDKKSLFVVPSDYILKDKEAGSTALAPELALPVSQFTLELKEVLSRLMDT